MKSSRPQKPEPISDPQPGPPSRERAFDALFRAHYPGLCRFAARILGSMPAAEDVVQEIFLYIWDHQETITGSTPSRAYLYRAAHNAALNRVRHLQVERRWAERSAIGEDGPEPAPGVELDHDELAAAVERAIEHLPQGCRLVYTMSRQEHLSYREIAAALDLSVKTVEAQMARAFRLLRKSLAPYILAPLLLLLGRG